MGPDAMLEPAQRTGIEPGRNDVRPQAVTAVGFGRWFVLRRARVAGVHDISVGRLAGMAFAVPVFVNTGFVWLATLSDMAGFRRLGGPLFFIVLMAEGRCQVNGHAMNGDRPAYGTAIS